MQTRSFGTTVSEGILELAQLYASGRLSTVELLDKLSGRVTTIEGELEADLWATCFEISDGDVTEEQGRQLIMDHLREL